MDAHCRVPDSWNLSFTANARNMAATVTVMLKNAPTKLHNETSDFPDVASETKINERWVNTENFISSQRP
jgi:hypothetical protein